MRIRRRHRHRRRTDDECRAGRDRDGDRRRSGRIRRGRRVRHLRAGGARRLDGDVGRRDRRRRVILHGHGEGGGGVVPGAIGRGHRHRGRPERQHRSDRLRVGQRHRAGRIRPRDRRRERGRRDLVAGRLVRLDRDVHRGQDRSRRVLNRDLEGLGRMVPVRVGRRLRHRGRADREERARQHRRARLRRVGDRHRPDRVVGSRNREEHRRARRRRLDRDVRGDGGEGRRRRVPDGDGEARVRVVPAQVDRVDTEGGRPDREDRPRALRVGDRRRADLAEDLRRVVRHGRAGRARRLGGEIRADPLDVRRRTGALLVRQDHGLARGQVLAAEARLPAPAAAPAAAPLAGVPVARAAVVAEQVVQRGLAVARQPVASVEPVVAVEVPAAVAVEVAVAVEPVLTIEPAVAVDPDRAAAPVAAVEPALAEPDAADEAEVVCVRVGLVDPLVRRGRERLQRLERIGRRRGRVARQPDRERDPPVGDVEGDGRARGRRAGREARVAAARVGCDRLAVALELDDHRRVVVAVGRRGREPDRVRGAVRVALRHERRPVGLDEIDGVLVRPEDVDVDDRNLVREGVPAVVAVPVAVPVVPAVLLAPTLILPAVVVEPTVAVAPLHVAPLVVAGAVHDEALAELRDVVRVGARDHVEDRAFGKRIVEVVAPVRRVRHGGHRDDGRRRPVRPVERERPRGRVEARIGARDDQVVVVVEQRDLHVRVQGRRHRRRDRVGVDDPVGRRALEHGRVAVALDDDEAGLVVVDDLRVDVADLSVVVDRIRALRAQAQHRVQRAFGGRVVDRADEHRLRAHVAGREGQHRGELPGQAVVDRDEHGAGTAGGRLGGRCGGGDVDVHRGGGRRDERDRERVDSLALLVDERGAAGLAHDHLADCLRRDAQRDTAAVIVVLHVRMAPAGAVDRLHVLVEGSADAVDALGHHRQRRVVVSDAVAVMAVDAEEEQPGDTVVARVVLDERLRRQILVGDVQAAAEHRVVVHGEVVVDLDRVVVAVVPAVERIVGRLAELAADDDEAVAVRPADDVDRSVDRVDRNDVVVVIPVVVELLGREGVDDDVARGRIDERRGPDGEQVVAAVALEIERGVIAVDEERVVAGAAEDRRREADAVAEVAERRQRGREGVFRRDVRRDARVRVRLADQEGVVAGAAVERRDRAVVVDGERVVAVAAVDGQPRVDVLVVVDPFDRGIHAGEDVVERAVEERDERRRLRILEAVVLRLADPRDLAHEEDVVAVGAVDRQRVETVVLGARVQNVDHVVLGEAAARVDDVRVGVALAVEGQRVAARDVHRRQLVHDEQILAVACGSVDAARTRQCACALGRRVAAVGARLAAEDGLVEVELVVVAVAVDLGDEAQPGAQRARSDDPGEVHDRALTVAGVGRAGLDAGEVAADAEGAGDPAVVAADGDVGAREDDRVGVGGDVVADPQQHRAERRPDQAVRDRLRRVLEEEDDTARQQVQILAGGRALADGEADGRLAEDAAGRAEERVVGSEGPQQDDVRRA